MLMRQLSLAIYPRHFANQFVGVPFGKNRISLRRVIQSTSLELLNETCRIYPAKGFYEDLETARSKFKGCQQISHIPTSLTHSMTEPTRTFNEITSQLASAHAH